MEQATLLSGTLEPLWRPESIVAVQLLLDRLVLRSLDSGVVLQEIYLSSVIGCHRMKGPSVDDLSSYFSIYAYPLLPPPHSCAGKQRRRCVFTFRIGCAGARDYAVSDCLETASPNDGAFAAKIYKRNVARASSWVAEILRIISVPLPCHRIRWLSNSDEHRDKFYLDNQLRQFAISGDPSRQRKLCVFVNPYSGPGKALQIVKETVMPVFAEAGILCNVFVTEHANHAKEIVEEMDLAEWDGFVIVSGDGLVYEVINGLMCRSDRVEALRIPIGIIPGGSGNALITSILHACKYVKPSLEIAQSWFWLYSKVSGNDPCLVLSEPLSKQGNALSSCLVAARPSYTPLKLVHVETMECSLISFMSFGWGLLSDIDIESEKFRKSLGSSRFTAGAIVRILKMRTYRGRVSFLPVTKSANATQSSGFLNGKCEDIRNGKDTGEENPTYNNFSMQPLSADIGQVVSIQPTAASCREPVVVSACNDQSASLPAPNRDGGDVGLGDVLKSHNKFRLPRLDEPVPLSDGWQTIEDDWINVYVAYLSHLSQDVHYIPSATLSEDQLYLTLIRGNACRVQIARFLLALERGEHLNNPCVEIIPVRAFRLEPLCGDGVLTVDGEAIKHSPVVQLSPTTYNATVMCCHDTERLPKAK